ncbi:MAG: hypothetical protein ACK5WZ_01345 [Pseudobdellovibrionaceae bacterium]
MNKADFIFRLSEHFLEAHSQVDRKSTFSVYYLPKSPLPQSLALFAKQLAQNTAQEKTNTNIVIDLPFLNSLLSYSLGGSVAQIRTKQTDAILKLSMGPANNLNQEEDGNSNRSSVLGAQNLTHVLSQEQIKNLIYELPTLLEQLKAKGAKRIVLHVTKNEISPETFEKFSTLSKELSLIAFPQSPEFLDYPYFFENLIDASLWGRYLENTQNFIDQIQLVFPDAKIFYDIDQKLNLIEKIDTFLPSKLLNHHRFETINTADMVANKSLLYVGLENLKWIKDSTETPGTLAFTSMLHLDQLKQIDFIDTNLKMSPGPVCFGRGSKLMVLDFLIYQKKLQGQLPQIGGVDLETNLVKVEKALQNLWRLSSFRTETFPKFLQHVQILVDEHFHIESLLFESDQMCGPFKDLLQKSRGS